MAGTPNLTQHMFRGRNDDGNETTATWIEAANTDWTQAVDVNFRVRFVVKENNSANPANFGCQLQYNLAAAGWNDVNATSSVVQSSASPNLADRAVLTQQLGSGTFSAGAFDEVDGELTEALDDTDIAQNTEGEYEFCVQIRSADVTDAQTLQLRLVWDSGAALTGYTQTPTITVSEGGAPANLRRYSLTMVGVG